MRLFDTKMFVFHGYHETVIYRTCDDRSAELQILSTGMFRMTDYFLQYPLTVCCIGHAYIHSSGIVF